MKFKIDENLPAELVDDLNAAGHEADTVAGQGMVGTADSVLMNHIQYQGQVLLTMDKGVADVRVYPPQQYAGIVLFRPRSTGRNYALSFVRLHLQTLLQATLVGHLVVVSESGIRMR